MTNTAQQNIEMRNVYCEVLTELANKDARVTALDADLMSSSGMADFASKFPDRFINVGIQEANMIGVAAGLSAAGMIPYAHSFAAFASRRDFDQVFVSCAYAKLNVKIIGSDPGITAAYNGGTHMALEDIGLMRTIPGMVIIEPADGNMLRKILPQINASYGVHYIRMFRKQKFSVYNENQKFTIGKASIVSDGKDITFISSGGICLQECLKASHMLSEAGYTTRIIDMFTIKPIDQDAVLRAAAETGAIVTIENHNILNGLGSAVAEVLAENVKVPFRRIGIPDQFGEVGSIPFLVGKFGLNADRIYRTALDVISQK